MRKHFLLLFLMALLPLASWAAAAVVDVTGLTLKARTYNGQPQALIEGTYNFPADYDTSEGGILFAATEGAAPTTDEGASSEYPKATNAGLYYVYYRVKADGVYTDGDWIQIGTTGVRINKATPQMTAPVGYSDLRYTTEAQALIQTVGTTNFGEMQYSLDNSVWYNAEEIATNIVGTDVQDYTVYYKAVAGENLTNNTGTIVVRIHGIAPTIVAPVGEETLVYDGTAKQLIATAATLTTGDGTLKYSLDKTNWYTDITDVALKETNANVEGYKVYYKMDGGTNYEDTEEHYIEVPIAKRNITDNNDIAITAGDLGFTGAALVHTTTLTVKDGLVDLVKDTDFEISSDNYENNVNAGNTAVAAITGKGNYTGTATETFTITPAGIDGLMAPNAPTIAAANYNGEIQLPEITWTMAEGAYAPTVYDDPNGDYSIVIKNAAQTEEVESPTAAATYKVIITGHNNLSGTTTIDYVINQAAVTVTATDVNIGVGVDPRSSFDVEYAPALFAEGDLGAITYDVTPNTTVDYADVATTKYTVEQILNLAAGTYNIWPTPAGNANYDITPAYGTLTVTAGQIVAKVDNQTVPFGTDFAASQIVHYSGLAEGKVEAFNTAFLAGAPTNYDYAAAGVTFTLYDEQGNVAEPVEGKTYYPVGTYTVKTTGNVTYPNYSVVIDWGTYTVEKQPLSGVAYAALAATYAGHDVTPVTTDKLTHAGLTLVENEDYTVELVAPTSTNNVDNKNVSGGGKTGKVKFTAVEGSNYSGTYSVEFTINRADLTITANDKVWIYGKEEPTSSYDATVEGLVGDDAELDLTQLQENFKAVLKVKRICGDGVGVYATGLEPYFALATTGAEVTGDANICNNYHVILNNGQLTVNKNTLKLKVKDVENVYGEAFAAAQLQFELADDPMNDGVEDIVKNNINSYLTFNNAEYTLEAATATADKYVVGTNYALGFAGTVTATNFDFDPTILPGTFTVSKRKIKLTALDQKVDLSETPAVGYESEFNEEAIAGTTVTAAKGDNAYTSIYAYDENLASLTIKLAYASFNVGDNVINIVLDNANDNYEYDVTPGNLDLRGAADVTFGDLTDPTPDAQKIITYNGKPVNVKINFTNRARTWAGWDAYWKAGYWNTLVLPFDISVADLSKALGYAIVNVINEGRTVIDGTDSQFYGKLTMTGGNGYHAGEADENTKLAANKPILVKTAGDITGVIDFGTQTIVAPADADACTVDAGLGAKFIGTYASKEVTAADNQKFWFMDGNENDWWYVNSSPWTIVPFESYLDLTKASAPNGVHSVTFVMEELNGSTTTISSVTADKRNGNFAAEGWYTVNGVKLQAAPTEKGVYINNGKKIVIK